MNSHLSRPEARFLAYGLVGWAIDSLFVSIHTGWHRPSSLLNLPVYGLAQPLFEPVHDRIRQHPLVLRAAVYGAGILAVEYTSGRLLRRVVGDVPWDYSRARFGIDGLVRLDYLPLWAAYGLGLERLHDLLVDPSGAQAGGWLSTSQVLGVGPAGGAVVHRLLRLSRMFKPNPANQCGPLLPDTC